MEAILLEEKIDESEMERCFVHLLSSKNVSENFLYLSEKLSDAFVLSIAFEIKQLKF